MKRVREDTYIQPNYLYNLIIECKDLLPNILKYLDLNAIYSLCRVIFNKTYDIDLILSNYLKCNYGNNFISYNNKVFRLAVDGYMEVHFHMKGSDSIDLYLTFVNRYNTVLYVSNLYLHGLCVYCKRLPQDFENIEIHKVLNKHSVNYSEYLYMCNDCFDEHKPNWLNNKKFIKKMGLPRDTNDETTQTYANNYNIRYIKDSGYIRFLKIDYLRNVKIPRLERGLSELKKRIS